VPLASVNEVGGDPRRPTTTPQSFHDHNRERRLRYPQAMLASTTHDTKRTEDVRARLNVLSEVPKEWRAAVQRFSRINKRWRREVDGLQAPSAKDEYLYYQSVIGIWPLTPPTSDERHTLILRLQGYMEKAVHESKQQTSWLNPSRAYDEAVREFVAQTLRDSPQNRFIAEAQALHDRIVDAGQYNALSQLALKLLSPGVPDIYQGQEMFDYSLVDPDNRRPVNYVMAREALAADGERTCYSLRDPRLKLMITRRLLDVRRRLAHLWSHGEYVSLEVLGPLADHVIAFAWRGGESRQIELVAAVPRFVQKLIDVQRLSRSDVPACQSFLQSQTWQGTIIVWPSGEPVAATDVFTSQPIELGEPAVEVASLLNGFPIAVLESKSASP
jgi:(1->4)-alpha-D-glucan 1-alpha-D-glucosylmutase